MESAAPVQETPISTREVKGFLLRALGRRGVCTGLKIQLTRFNSLSAHFLWEDGGMVDTLVLETSIFGYVGSTPTLPTYYALVVEW